MEGIQPVQLTNSSVPEVQKNEAEATTTADIDKMVARILDLMKNSNNGAKSPSRESELLGLIEEFHKQYQLLFALYEHLKQVSGINHHQKSNRFNFHPASPTHSDSEYFSSEEVDEELIILKNILSSTAKERDSLDAKYTAALSKIEEAEAVIRDLSIEANETKRAVVEEASVKMKELKSEAESLQRNNRQLASKLEKKATKAKKLKEENSGLKARGLELELISKNKVNEMSELMKNLKDSENEEALKVAELTAKVNGLEQEVGSVHAFKCKLEAEMEALRNEKMAREKDFKKRVDTLLSKKRELVSQLEEKKSEVSEKSEECKCLAEQVKDLKLKVDKLGDTLNSKTNEIDHLREEKEGLGARINELERKMAEKVGEEEANFMHLTGLKIEVDNLHQELESIRSQRSRLEQESSRRISLLEKENRQLTNTVRDLKSEKNGDQVIDREELEDKVVELERLVKEKDEGLLVLGEEKREAIRQLCIQVEYQRTRCGYYKEAITKMARSGGRR